MSDKTPTIDSNLRSARGANTNREGRYERYVTDIFDDGWGQPIERDKIITHVAFERAKTVISYNKSPDLPFDRSINPYRGCEHGCIYCFARPSHAYLGYSPGMDFETRLIAKSNVADVLADQLRHRRYRVRPIAIGTNTDPYQPVERDLRLMRSCLQVLQAANHPVAIVTKGTLIERDLDILSDMATRNLVRVGVSVTTLDAKIARVMEPRAPAPKRRLQTITRLANAGIPVRAMLSPIVPGLTDHEIEPLVKAAADAGAQAAGWIMLRLPREVTELFQQWLQEHFPERAARVMNRVRDTQGGKDYDPTFGTRMRGQGTYAKIIAQRFDKSFKRNSLESKSYPMDCTLFCRPERVGDQLDFFG